MTLDQYKDRFINRMTSQGVRRDIAETELAAHLESNPDLWEHRVDPEHDADEAVSYWQD